MNSLRVGIVDTGIDTPLSHGSEIAALLRAGHSGLELLAADVFPERGRCSPAQIAAALDRLVDAGARLVNMSLGTRRAEAQLRAACERAAAAGVLLVASAPARGAPVYPAAYAQCIAVSGDARCGEDEISWLDGGNADFGAHPFFIPGDASRGGASYAAARVAGRIAALLATGTPAADVVAALRAHCRYHGPERRLA